MSWQPRESWRALALLRRVARHVCRAEGFRTGDLGIAVVGARTMVTLHHRYLGRTGLTDVLSFDLANDPRRGHLDAQIILCADVARQRATGNPRSPTRHPESRWLPRARAELALYLTHAILHLAGYDDHAPAEFRRMHAREDELLAQLGLGPVFSRYT